MRSRLILTVLVSVAAITLIGLGILRGSLFRVNNIEIICDELTEEEIDTLITASGLTVGDSIFKVNEDKVKNALLATGEYYAEKVMVVYPSTVKINIVKKHPAAVVEYNGMYIITDKDLSTIKTQRSIEDINLIHVTGLRLSEYQIGTPLITKDSYQSNVATTILNELIQSNTVNIISAISLENLSDIYLITVNGKRIDLHEAVDILPKLQWLSEQALQDIIFGDDERKITLYKDQFVIG